MSARSLLRQLVAEAFPWIERFGLTAKGDLAIKSASSKIEFAGGDKAVHRVDDLGDGGTITIPFAGTLRYTGPDGTQWGLTFTSAAPGAPVAIALVPITPVASAGKLTTKATTGSEKVSSG